MGRLPTNEVHNQDYFELLSRQVLQLDLKTRAYNRGISQAPATLRDEAQRYKYMFNQSTDLLEFKSSVFETSKKLIQHLQQENENLELKLDQLKEVEIYKAEEIILNERRLHAHQLGKRDEEIQALKKRIDELSNKLSSSRKEEDDIQNKEIVIKQLLEERRKSMAELQQQKLLQQDPQESKEAKEVIKVTNLFRGEISIVRKGIEQLTAKLGESQLVQELINRNESVVKDSVNMSAIVTQQKIEIDRLQNIITLQLGGQNGSTLQDIHNIEENARKVIAEKISFLEARYSESARNLGTMNIHKYKKLLQLRTQNEINEKVRIIKSLERENNELTLLCKKFKSINEQLLKEDQQNKKLMLLKDNVIRADQKLLLAYDVNKPNGIKR